MSRLNWFVSGAVVIAAICGCANHDGESVTKSWPFEMEKVWEIRQIDDMELLRPAEPRVADNGTLFFRDFERNLSFIVDSEGNSIGSFAAQGENEGDVSFYINCFPADKNVAVCAPDKINFYTGQGDFIKSVPNNLFVRFPLAFKNENQFWLAPGALGDAPGDSAEITFVDLAANSESVVRSLARSEIEKTPTGGAVILGLTPQLKMAYDRSSDQAFFGKNSDTIIYGLDADGSITSFSFTGSKVPVSEDEKRAHFARFDIPEEHLSTLLAALPDRLAYYNRIEAINGLIYMIRSGRFSGPHYGQTVDIYSPDGRHLYTGQIQLEPGWHIFGSIDNIQLINGYVYAVQENDAGEKKIVKYRVTLPAA